MAVKAERYLTKTTQYGLVYNKGNSWASSLTVMKALPNGLGLTRYGFSVSRRVGNAVVRNRTKRLFREILRHMPLQPGWDIMFIARPRAAGISYTGLEKTVQELVGRAGLLVKEYDKDCPDTD